jgi:hypothetical protein
MVENSNLDLEWQNRKLCSDGHCIGVIGKDGFCSECGKEFKENTEELPDDPRVQASGDEEEIPDENRKDSRFSTDMDWENRTLCSDESCIGIIGPDGLCTECGKPLPDETHGIT